MSIPHNVLNARYHEQEAAIIAQAGVPGTVTIATNMAGRGTDIQLGGNADMRIALELAHITDESERSRLSADIRDEVARNKAVVIDAGGLFVIGTERHESRRIDNQLRGRSGRQGDPGRSRFFLSLEDDLMRIFGSERMDKMLQTLGLKEGEAIIHPWINKALEKAQQKVEARNFDIRKNLLKFDNVMNDQRKVIFEQRIDIMRGEEVSATVDDMRAEIINDLVATHIPANAYAEQWNAGGLRSRLREVLGLDLPVDEWAREEGIAEEEIHERVAKAANDRYAAKREKYSADVMGQVEKAILLQTLDHLWREHLVVLEHLRQVIGLRGYGQRDPLNEYKTEGFNLFEQMIQRLRELVTGQLMRVEVAERPPEQLLPEESELPEMEGHHVNTLTGEDDMREPAVVFGASRMDGRNARTDKPASDPKDVDSWGKVGRNERCPCGSGKKFKHCHGVFA
jgi:preprotein translocase subunit SecA